MSAMSFKALAIVGAVTASVFVSNGASGNTLTITPSAGFSISYTGVEGQYFNSSPTTYVPTVPANAARSDTGSLAFGSGALGPPNHTIAHANDGIYGNNQSWLVNSVNPEYIGVAFATGGTTTPTPTTVNISKVAFGRDNGMTSENNAIVQYMDRTFDTYTLQYTTISSPGTGTTVTGNPATGWQTIGTLGYASTGTQADFVSPWLRHEYNVGLAGGGAIPGATGFRITVGSGQTAIDEVEVNPVPEPTSVALLGSAGLLLARRRRA